MYQLVRRFYDWAAPWPPDADDDIRAEIERTLFSEALHFSRVVVFVAPPTALAWVALLWTSARPNGLALWFALILIADIGIHRASASHSSNDTIAETTRRLGNGLVGSGFAWGALPLLTLQPGDDWFPLVGMMALATMAGNAIFSAAVPRFFWSFQLTIMAVASAGLLIQGGTATLPVVAILVYATPLAALLTRVSRASAARGAYFAATAQRTAEELKDVNTSLAYRASHDSLTGLVNRQEFARHLENETSRRSARPIGLLYMDLDRFKRINDTLGHIVGDELLRVAAQRIKTRVRPGDVVARLGGDEFTVLLSPGCTEEELEAVAGRILHAFEEPFLLFGQSYRVGISIGSSFAPEPVPADELLRNADTALYVAKEEGRGCIRRYHESQRRASSPD